MIRSMGRPTLMMLLLMAGLSAGCTGNQRPVYRSDEAAIASIAGFERIRVYADASPGALPADANDWVLPSRNRELNFLFISGGGSGGAFTVGILSAWSAKGTRPNFDVVTGVSTGALIAPLAFLGKSYDDRLVKLYTGGVARKLVELRWMGTGVFGKSLLKSEPLEAMVAENITTDVLHAIAAEHRKGRRLLVLTANLDSQKAVVWNMGAIADSGRPDALALFRKVLVASASVPGAYPAVLIRAKAGERVIEEMHSDGGSALQVLTMPEMLMAAPGTPKPPGFGKVNLYVVINNALIPEFSNTSNSTLPVVSRAYAMLVKSQTRQTLLALYGYSQRAGMKFHVASIDKQIPYSMLDPFNTKYMRSVFAIGYSKTMEGRIWEDRPIFQ